MIVKKVWIARTRFKYIGGTRDAWQREGWFLFGFIPLYVRDISVRSN